MESKTRRAENSKCMQSLRIQSTLVLATLYFIGSSYGLLVIWLFQHFWARLLFFCVWHRCSFGNKIWITSYCISTCNCDKFKTCLYGCYMYVESWKFFIVHVFSVFQLASYFHNIQSNEKALWVNAHSLVQKCLKTEFNINLAFKTCAIVWTLFSDLPMTKHYQWKFANTANWKYCIIINQMEALLNWLYYYTVYKCLETIIPGSLGAAFSYNLLTLDARMATRC